MRRILLAAICSVLVGVIALGAPTGPAAAQDDVFSGTWTSIDVDGSNQELDITGSGQGAYGMFLFDDFATVCGGPPANFVGSGFADGNTLVMSGTIACRPGGNVLGFRIELEFVYSPKKDTLTDSTGVTWHRA